MEENAKAPFLKPALIYGAILGIVSVFISLVFYFLGMTADRWTSWVSTLIVLVLLVYLMIQYRKEYLGGYASFGQIFVMVLVSAGIVATIISTVYSYLLYTVIDPGLLDQMKVVAQERIMNNPRIPESMYDNLFERMEKNFQISRMMKLGLIGGIVIYAILGLIIAAFLKKEEDLSQPV
jgi:hypothetical protein